MKKLLILALFMFFASNIYTQNASLEASIDGSCNSKPATLNISKGQSASAFVLQSLSSGNNCYNGARFTDKGYVIKNSAGDVIFKYSIDVNGKIYQPNGDLSQLKLNAGIYHIYVDGGSGAYLKLNFQLN